jgi:DNA-binding GntR family transcriptional regulator
MPKSVIEEETGAIARLTPGSQIPTLAEAIRAGLADEITSGKLAPGTVIDEQEIAKRFNASRTPVREALRELAAAGLVEIEPRRGSRVAALTVDRLAEMFELMAETEAMCARLATHRMTPSERIAVQTIHRRSQDAMKKCDIDRYDAANREFHAAIYRGTHNAFLADHAAALRLRLAPFRRAQFLPEQRIADSFAEHEAIVTCILRSDGEEAGRLMRAHMLIASAALAEYLGDSSARLGNPLIAAIRSATKNGSGDV